MKSILIGMVFGIAALSVTSAEAGVLRCLACKVASVRPVKRVVTEVQPVRRTLRTVQGVVCSGSTCQ